MIGLLGEKMGMTQVFDDRGHAVPVTVIRAFEGTIIDVKTSEKHGYAAIRLGYGRLGKKKTNKAIEGVFAARKIDPVMRIKEFKVDDPGTYQMNQKVGVDIFSEVQFVDVSGVTKGKGFQGVVRRHGFSGGPGGHGSHFHRAPGSIGMCSFPGRILKGKKMAGQMGNRRRTLQNLSVIKVDKENALLLVKGAVPGKNRGWVMIRKAVKLAGPR